MKKFHEEDYIYLGMNPVELPFCNQSLIHEKFSRGIIKFISRKVNTISSLAIPPA
jgi:hypothetical protein